jgi:hypothetical protein
VRKLLLALLLVLIPASGYGQGVVATANRRGAALPSKCSEAQTFQLTTTHILYTCGPANTWSAAGQGGGATGANAALSNLASVAVNAALVPGTAGALALGSTTKPWGDIFFAGTSGTPGTNNFKFTGASTSGTRTLTLPDRSATVATTSGSLTNGKCVEFDANGNLVVAASNAACGSGGSTSGIVHLYPGGYGTDGTGSGNDSATVAYETSTGTQTTNTPKVQQQVLVFPTTPDQHWLFSLQLPHNYSSGGTLRGTVRITNTTNNIVMKAGQVCSTNDTTDDTTTIFTAADLSSAFGTDSTLQLQTFTITLTTTGMVADRKCVIFIGRDTDNASDTNAGDARLASLDLEFTTS